MTQSYNWVLLCSDVMGYCRKVSALEGSKNRDSLLKKLVCRYEGIVCVRMYMSGLRVDMCRGVWVGGREIEGGQCVCLSEWFGMSYVISTHEY